MKKLLAIVLLSLSLTGCTTFDRIQNSFVAINSATVSPQLVLLASNTFDGLQVTATNYLNLKRCRSATLSPICRDPTATAILIPAVRSGRMARDELQEFYKRHPGSLGPQGTYDALQASIRTIEGIFAQYRIQG